MLLLNQNYEYIWTSSFLTYGSYYLFFDRITKKLCIYTAIRSRKLKSINFYKL